MSYFDDSKNFRVKNRTIAHASDLNNLSNRMSTVFSDIESDVSNIPSFSDVAKGYAYTYDGSSHGYWEGIKTLLTENQEFVWRYHNGPLTKYHTVTYYINKAQNVLTASCYEWPAYISLVSLSCYEEVISQFTHKGKGNELVREDGNVWEDHYSLDTYYQCSSDWVYGGGDDRELPDNSTESCRSVDDTVNWLKAHSEGSSDTVYKVDHVFSLQWGDDPGNGAVWPLSVTGGLSCNFNGLNKRGGLDSWNRYCLFPSGEIPRSGKNLPCGTGEEIGHANYPGDDLSLWAQVGAGATVTQDGVTGNGQPIWKVVFNDFGSSNGIRLDSTPPMELGGTNATMYSVLNHRVQDTAPASAFGGDFHVLAGSFFSGNSKFYTTAKEIPDTSQSSFLLYENDIDGTHRPIWITVANLSYFYVKYDLNPAYHIANSELKWTASLVSNVSLLDGFSVHIKAYQQDTSTPTWDGGFSDSIKTYWSLLGCSLTHDPATNNVVLTVGSSSWVVGSYTAGEEEAVSVAVDIPNNEVRVYRKGTYTTYTPPSGLTETIAPQASFGDLNGTVSEFDIWSRALTEQELAALQP